MLGEGAEFFLYTFHCIYSIAMTSIVDRIRPVVFASKARLFSNGGAPPERISLKVRLWDSSGKKVVKDTEFTIKPDSPLKNILRIYAVREAVNPECLGYFRFMVGSKEIGGDESANDVCINDGDCIDAIPSLDDVVGARFV